MLTNFFIKMLSLQSSHSGGFEITNSNCNYYFLLYIDNELTAEEKKQVELFLQNKPQYQKQFNELLQTKLPKETILYSKANLYKTPIINSSNYESYFVQFVNDELSNTDKLLVQEFINSNPNLQNEFITLQKTKLISESIIYPNKKLLYKKTEKEKPVLSLWLKYAASVCLLLFALWFVFNKFGNNKIEPNITITTTNKNNNLSNLIAKDTTKLNTLLNSSKASELSFTKGLNEMTSTKIKEARSISINYQNTSKVKNSLIKTQPVTLFKEERNTNINNTTKLKLPEELIKDTLNEQSDLSIANANINQIKESNITELKNLNKIQNSNLNFAFNNEISNLNEVSILNIPIEKIDKKEKIKKQNTKFSNYINNTLKNIANTKINIGKYEIGFAN